MPGEQKRAAVRYAVRRSLRLLVEQATWQGCLDDLLCFPDVFVVFIVVSHPFMSEAVRSGMVTISEITAWLEVLLYGEGDDGPVC